MPDPKDSAPKASADPIDTRLVRRLADILNDSGLTEIEVERGDLRIKAAQASRPPPSTPHRRRSRSRPRQARPPPTVRPRATW
jgi:hypothetical protein